MHYFEKLLSIRRSTQGYYCIKDFMAILKRSNVSTTMDILPKELRLDDYFKSTHFMLRPMKATTLEGILYLCSHMKSYSLYEAGIKFYLHQRSKVGNSNEEITPAPTTPTPKKLRPQNDPNHPDYNPYALTEEEEAEAERDIAINGLPEKQVAPHRHEQMTHEEIKVLDIRTCIDKGYRTETSDPDADDRVDDFIAKIVDDTIEDRYRPYLEKYGFEIGISPVTKTAYIPFDKFSKK